MKLISIKEQEPPFGEEVIFHNPKWIHEDFNPKGIRIGFRCDLMGYVSAYWCDQHDDYCTRTSDEDNENFELSKAEDQIPTHWASIEFEKQAPTPYEIADESDQNCLQGKRPGRIVLHIDGRKGRTFNETDIIEGKVPVYFAIEYNRQVPVKFSTTASLVDPAKLSVIGYID